MESISGNLFLKPGRDKSIVRHHPWIFSGAIKRFEGDLQPGDLVAVRAAGGEYLATAYVNKRSQIQARIVTWDANDVIDDAFWRERLVRALAWRDQLQLSAETNAVRLVNAEADGLPGLVVDKYGDYLVMQCLTAGIDSRKQMLAALLVELLQPTAVIDRSDAPVRKKEGLSLTTDVLYGVAIPDEVVITENGLKFAVDLLNGHKTGFYLDQRDNRTVACARRYVADGDVLNVFAYTGGFGVYAAVNGARSVVHVDSSAESIALAQANMRRNGYHRRQDEYIVADAFQLLRDYRDSGRQFDTIILDPPKFAHSQRDVNRATRGYKDLNWLAFRLLRPGGILATFSCSGLVSADLFQKVVFGAVIDAGRDAQIVQTMTQSADHPVLLSFPESAYLKGLLCRVW
ncbi:MAG: class I SAM-dependent rRNA methyltransferase [Anaerolineae bacterium]|nr:class I SAM-dependent rRNA methyltransferase [Anaerolineae bacterium]